MWSCGGKGPVSKTAARPTDDECSSVGRTQLSDTGVRKKRKVEESSNYLLTLPMPRVTNSRFTTDEKLANELNEGHHGLTNSKTKWTFVEPINDHTMRTYTAIIVEGKISKLFGNVPPQNVTCCELGVKSFLKVLLIFVEVVCKGPFIATQLNSTRRRVELS